MAAVAELVAVTKTYRRGAEEVTPIREYSLALAPGEVVALTGPSGAGKSTILNLLAGFDVPDAGQVRLGDLDIAGIPAAELDRLRSSRVGFMFQQFNLVAGISARENVGLALVPRGIDRKTRHDRADRLLDRLGLTGMGDRRPSQLSGGQQQRVAVARALVGEPGLVLADEPTAALDRGAAEALLTDLTALARERGVAVLISTHDPRCLAVADRIVALDTRS